MAITYSQVNKLSFTGNIISINIATVGLIVRSELLKSKTGVLVLWFVSSASPLLPYDYITLLPYEFASTGLSLVRDFRTRVLHRSTPQPLPGASYKQLV